MSEVSRFLKRLEPYCLPLCLMLQALLLFWQLDRLPVWGDEFVTLDVSTRPFRDIPKHLSKDIHPPLYYFLLHFWAQLPLSGSLIVRMRAFSGVWALATTVVLDRLWLRGESRWRFLILWSLSPCLILYGRMARSYTLQLFLGSLALYWGLALIRDPRRRDVILPYAIASCLLFYTHYVPALAIVGAVEALLLYRLVRRQNAWFAMTVPLAIMLVLYLPWVNMLSSAVDLALRVESYSILSNPVAEQIVRLGYLTFSFTFGETPSVGVVITGVLLAPVLLYLLWRERRAEWFPLVLIAATIGYVGVTRVVSFAFVPARLLFILPFYLILLARRTWTFVAVACLSVASLESYYRQQNFLNKGYLLPLDQIAEIIEQDSGVHPAQLMVNAPGLDATPLIRRLGFDANPQPSPEIIWVLNNHGLHTPPPGAREVWRRQFVRFSELDRVGMELLNWPDKPGYVLELTKYVAN